jgi:hypothetical protein
LQHHSDMKTFSELTAKRQAAVLQLMDIFPSVAETGQITLAQCKEYAALGKAGKIKPASHLMFLYGPHENRTGTRGLYNVPLPTKDDIVKTLSPKKLTMPSRSVTITIDTESPVLSKHEFEAECKAAGIV